MKKVTSLFLEIVEIDEDNMYMKIDLIKQNTMVLLPVAVKKFEI